MSIKYMGICENLQNLWLKENFLRSKKNQVKSGSQNQTPQICREALRL